MTFSKERNKGKESREIKRQIVKEGERKKIKRTGSLEKKKGEDEK